MMKSEERYTHRNWRALDASPSFFGVKGRFQFLYALLAAGGLIPSLLIWNTLSSILGMVCTLAVLIADYLFILWLEGKITERQFSRMLCKLKLRRFSRVLPLSVHEYIQNDIKWK